MTLETGDRVYVYGGYYFPEWLGDRSEVTGTVQSWITGSNGNRQCVVVLDEPHEAEGRYGSERIRVSGRFLVLHRRHRGQQWDESGTVHIELFAEDPSLLDPVGKMRGAWVESHAQYRKHPR